MATIDSPAGSKRSPQQPLIATPSLTAWETVFNPGGSKAIQVNLIELRDGSGKYNRIYLIALGCITAARSVAEAPVALGRLVIEIIEWGIDFKRTYGELGELIHTEVSDCLRCVKMAFIITGLNVGGIFAPSWSFGALKNMPKTVTLQTTEKNLELSKLQKECVALQKQVTDLQNKLEQAEKEFTTQKNNLDQTLKTISKQGESLAEAQRLQADLDSLNDKVKTHKTQLEELNKEFATHKETLTKETNTASAELTRINSEISTEKETLNQCRNTLKTLTEEHEALKKKKADLINNVIPGLTKQEADLKASTEQWTARQNELTNQINLKTAEILTQEKALEEKQAELTKLQDHISALEKAKGEFEGTHMAPLRLEKIALQENIAALQKELEKETAQFDTKTGTTQELIKEQERLELKVNELRKLDLELNTKIEAKQRETTDLEKLTAEVAAKQKELTTETVRLAKEVASAQASEKDIKAKTTEAEAALDKTTKALEELKKQHQTTLGEKETLDSKVKSLTELQEKLKAEVEAKQQELATETTRVFQEIVTAQEREKVVKAKTTQAENNLADLEQRSKKATEIK